MLDTEKNLERPPLTTAENSHTAAKDSARALADEFLRHALDAGRIRLRCIDLLCRLAMHREDEISRIGLQALYGTVVEGLCDDFSETGVRICNLVLLRILSFLTALQEGQEIAALLSRFGIPGPASLLPRYERLRFPSALPVDIREKANRVVVLSRVSVGADVAITSVLVQRLQAAFPQAEVVVVGPGHLYEFFAESRRLRWVRLDYRRYGSLSDRFTVWPRLVELIARESEGLAADRLLLFDPDTRLSQLGLLPLVDERQTCYFSSRTNPFVDREPSLPELTNFWLDRVLAEENPKSPELFLPAAMLGSARTCCGRLRQRGAQAVIVINLGVGNDPRKRLADPFEEELLAALLQSLKNTVILLDTGGDSEEKERIDALIMAAGRRGFATGFLDQKELPGWEPPFAHGMVGFHGSVGALAALISQADAFCGYDSSGQHLAGALQTPAVIIFAGAPNPRFFVRWRSLSPAADTIQVGRALSARGRAELIDKIVSRLHENGNRPG
jgi:ADP-heptose:LPS heptosyltransferase